MKKLVTSPISNSIYLATVNEEKQMITGKKEDVTENAIGCVHQSLLGSATDEKPYFGFSFVDGTTILSIRKGYGFLIEKLESEDEA